jgi:hypothetical protein
VKKIIFVCICCLLSACIKVNFIPVPSHDDFTYFPKSEWEQKTSCDWIMHRGSEREYKAAHYWHFHHKTTAAGGAQAGIFDDPEIVLRWCWEDQRRDETVTTYLKLEDGTWAKGVRGEFQDYEEHWLGNKISSVKITLKGENGKIHERWFYRCPLAGTFFGR